MAEVHLDNKCFRALARSLIWIKGRARSASGARGRQLAPCAANRPTICTAMTFTIVIEGKIIA
jgi:hypothetical protein